MHESGSRAILCIDLIERSLCARNHGAKSRDVLPGAPERGAISDVQERAGHALENGHQRDEKIVVLTEKRKPQARVIECGVGIPARD